MQASRQQLFDTLVSSGLIAAEEVRSLQKSLPRDEGCGGLRELSRLLVAEKRLTAFQARAVREGRLDELVLGNYLLLEPLGQGGMGEIFKARHRRMDRVVAVKLLRSGTLATEELRQRFQREVKAAAKLSHPNIVAAYDADEVAGRPFLVMEYVDGCDLAALVEQLGPLSVGEASECLLQIAAGLEYAHARGVIHRDLKPSNVLADRQGRLKILDLGLARLDEPDSSQLPNAARLTASGQIMGTVDYMAPEQAIDSRRVDP